MICTFLFVIVSNVLFRFWEWFVPNFSTIVSTFSVLFWIKKFCSVYRRVMSWISTKMCQLIVFYSSKKQKFYRNYKFFSLFLECICTFLFLISKQMCQLKFCSDFRSADCLIFQCKFSFLFQSVKFLPF